VLVMYFHHRYAAEAGKADGQQAASIASSRILAWETSANCKTDRADP